MRRLRVVVDQPDLAVAALLAVLGALAGLGAVDAIGIARVALVVPLVLFLPGYALVNAALATLHIPAIERALMSAGASIAMSILLGLAMGMLSIGLGPATWSLGLAALTLLLLSLAWVQRARLGILGVRPSVARMPLRSATLVMISLLIAADAVLAANFAARDAAQPVPIQLWMVGAADNPDGARLGMRAGPDGGDFSIVISSSGEILRRIDLSLSAEETWETIVVFPAEVRVAPIVARLYQGADPNELRYVTLQPLT